MTKKEMIWLRNVLEAKRAYRHTPIPHGSVLWEEWQEDLYEKVLDGLESLPKG